MPGRVEFMGVVLRYAGQSAPALDGLDLDVPGGSKIGVCGRTGKLSVLCLDQELSCLIGLAGATLGC